MIKYVICPMDNPKMCYTGAETIQEALKKVEYWREVKKVNVVLRQIKF